MCDIQVLQHEIFERNEKHLNYKKEITFVEACLGAKVIIPLLGGSETELTIPAGTQTHTIFTLKGMGLPSHSSNRRGDQFVVVGVTVPKDLEDYQKELLQQFADSFS
mgnify:FL=1